MRGLEEKAGQKKTKRDRPSASNAFDHATHYTYDIHGNVKELVQDNPELSALDQEYKKIIYEYDLVSGKVGTGTYGYMAQKP